MPDAICDTGPILHLHEIGCLQVLSSFDVLRLPDLVVEELRAYRLDLPVLSAINLHTDVIHLQEAEWGRLGQISISVLALIRHSRSNPSAAS